MMKTNVNPGHISFINALREIIFSDFNSKKISRKKTLNIKKIIMNEIFLLGKVFYSKYEFHISFIGILISSIYCGEFDGCEPGWFRYDKSKCVFIYDFESESIAK